VADPGQTKDVSAAHPEVAARLKKAVADWASEVLPAGPDDRPYPVGHTRMTYLPARDGEFTGGIQRSNRAPNSSYFMNWKSPEDRITWDIEVAQAGEYEAVMHYTAPQAGSRIELSFQNTKVDAKIAEAHNPPLYGMKQDRTDRGTESYAKNFKPLRLGVLKLAKGRGKLTLRALEIAPGAEVADVRYIILTRK